MRAQTIYWTLTFTVICSTVFAGPQEEPSQAVALTIYTDNFAVVRESRQMSFEQGINTVKFTDVASAIDPTSVNFKCLSSPGAVSILEQNYEYDLVNQASLLKRYIDKDVTIRVRGSGADTGMKVSGQLLNFAGNNLTLKTESGTIELINEQSVENISLSKLPEGLVTKPTLVWLASAKEKGDQLCQITYTTGKIGWDADYSALLNAEETEIDFTGWVTIDNKSGATYKNSTIKLIAGDVRRIVEPVIRPRDVAMYAEAKAPPIGGFEEKPFMEYHLYTLGRKSTINNNQVKQIEFITPALGVPIEKIYIYNRNQQKDKVQIKLEFENKKENKLGIALPKGKVRVFKKDPADDNLEFVGEDQIDHTARKERISLYIGNAFDIVPEHTIIDSKHARRMRQDTHKIEFINSKDSAVTVCVDEKFPERVNWSIDKSTHKYEKRDARTARFKVEIKADSVSIVQYTATQTW